MAVLCVSASSTLAILTTPTTTLRALSRIGVLDDGDQSQHARIIHTFEWIYRFNLLRHEWSWRNAYCLRIFCSCFSKRN
jgi:hypothetical protein